MKRIVAVSCLVLAVGIASAYAGCGTCDKSVVAAAAHNDDFKTLVAAVEAAGLADALSGACPPAWVYGRSVRCHASTLCTQAALLGQPYRR